MHIGSLPNFPFIHPSSTQSVLHLMVRPVQSKNSSECRQGKWPPSDATSFKYLASSLTTFNVYLP